MRRRIASPTHTEPCGTCSSATLAALDHAEGRTDTAYRRLSRALAIAAPHDTFFPFLTDDENFSRLLADFARSGTDHELTLATIFELRDRTHPALAHRGLTPRERELLGLLRTSMTAAELAASLHLSVATVKTHLQSIYRKLGVSTRRAALRIAHH